LWYLYSIYPSTWSTPEYNQGIAGGEFLSVAGDGRNLQLALTNNITYYFRWFGDADGPGYLTFANQTYWPGRLPRPVTLIGPADGATVDANGAVLSCGVSDYSVGYQLLIGPDPYSMDYILSDTNQPPLNQVNTFPFENTYWTIKARDQYGTTIYADPIYIRSANIARPIRDTSGRQYLTCTGYDLLRQKRISRTEFEYCLRMRIKNLGFYDVNNKTAELESVPDNVHVLNGKVCFSTIPAQQEALSDDSFIVRIDRQTAIDEKDIIWRIS
jgi:hypothetical protein